MTALEASRAALIIAQVKAGESPVPEPMKQAGDPTVSELAMRYLTEYVEVWCRPRTIKTDRSVVYKHIAPTLGKLTLIVVERAQVAKLRERLCATPAVANQAVLTLSAMYRLAEGWGLVPEGINPCRSIMKYHRHRRERFFTEAEFERLGCVLDTVEPNESRLPITGPQNTLSAKLFRYRNNRCVGTFSENLPDVDADELL